jgi:hypothetical protein
MSLSPPFPDLRAVAVIVFWQIRLKSFWQNRRKKFFRFYVEKVSTHFRPKYSERKDRYDG